MDTGTGNLCLNLQIQVLIFKQNFRYTFRYVQVLAGKPVEYRYRYDILLSFIGKDFFDEFDKFCSDGIYKHFVNIHNNCLS